MKRTWFIVVIFALFFVQACTAKPEIRPTEVIEPSTSPSTITESEPTIVAATSTVSPTKRPTNTVSPTVASTPTVLPTETITMIVTPVPLGVFALLFYPPLVFDYDPSVWEDQSNFTDTSTIVNSLQARDLPTCSLGPQGPSGNYPPADEIVKLGNIQYEFSSGVSEVTGKVIALYILNSEIKGDNPENGLTKINVIASPTEWEQCKLLAEDVLSTLHASP